MKTFTSVSQKRGELGENIACRFLGERGFAIVERNYTKKWGEIDIVARNGGVVHFVEVKSVTRENIDDISHETEFVRPEEQMHSRKLERLRRVVETYLAENNVSEWWFDLACVYIDEKRKRAKVKLLENIVL